MISSASAMNFYLPNEVKMNDDFDIKFSDSTGLSVIEVDIPDGFVISSDPTFGILKDGVFRTSFYGTATITLKAVKEGTFVFKVTFTEGVGVSDLTEKSIFVNPAISEKVCPTCPSSEWTACIESQRTKLLYECGVTTEYVCKPKGVSESCVDDELCVEDWVCVDDDRIGLQNSECLYNAILDCENGCNKEKNVCNGFENNNQITARVAGGDDDGEFGVVKLFRWLGNGFGSIVNWFRSLLGLGG